jgi:hypothetical protein
MGHRFQLMPQLLRFRTTKVELKFTNYFLKFLPMSNSCFPIYIYILLPPFIIFFKYKLDLKSTLSTIN